jgi:putative hydrolase of the HAD superfamily
VSGHHGYHKPDVRLFLRACEDLGVLPEECVMVGDRIDNDVVPARLLGMRTILFRTGRHIAQQPRSAHDVPAREVRDVDELRAALLELPQGETG